LVQSFLIAVHVGLTHPPLRIGGASGFGVVPDPPRWPRSSLYTSPPLKDAPWV
jgi:hypothetical protein